MIIYKVQNKINGKIYIGQTIKTLENRMYGHLYNVREGSKYPFYAAIRKYGFQSFKWSIVDTSNFREILNEKEVYWISYFNSKIPNGYNITDGGEGNSEPRTEEWKRKIGEAHKGLKVSEETKKKMSEAHKGMERSREWRKNNGDARKGFKHSEETKEKLRKYKPSEEHRKKVSEANKGRKHSEEYKRKMSQTIKEVWRNRKLI